MESVGKDVPAMLKYLTEINGKVEQVKDHVTLLYHHTQSEECSSGGVDLLELKNQLLLRSYYNYRSPTILMSAILYRSPTILMSAILYRSPTILMSAILYRSPTILMSDII